MATIVKGPKKGNVVNIVDIKGEFALLADRGRIRLGCLQVDQWEREIIIERHTAGDTFRIFYDLAWFIETNRFKKISWARV